MALPNDWKRLRRGLYGTAVIFVQAAIVNQHENITFTV